MQKVFRRNILFNTMLKYYLTELFEPTLLFGLLPAILGIIVAWHLGATALIYGVLAAVGVVLAQMAVNLIDDYVDFKSGLDKDTEHTKFSGGSSLVTKGMIKLDNVLKLGLLCLAAASLIGVYLIVKDLLLLPFFLIGIFSVVFYTKYLLKVPFAGEPVAALSFVCIVLGTFIASGGQHLLLGIAAFAAVPAGLQVGIAVLVNEVPDRKADAKHGRRHSAVMFKSMRTEALYYLALNIITYAVVSVGVVLRALPLQSLLVFLTAPIVWAVGCSMANYKSAKGYVPAMANGAMTELGMILILILSFV